VSVHWPEEQMVYLEEGGRVMETQKFSPSEVAEAKRWGFNDVAAWKDAMLRSGMLTDMGYTTEETDQFIEDRLNDC
jgi:hypothetical protein